MADAKALARATRRSARRCCRCSTRRPTSSRCEWIAEYINVPLDQMTGVLRRHLRRRRRWARPKGKTQEIYALLDAVVQAVLTDQNADIDALLTQADKDAQALLDS